MVQVAHCSANSGDPMCIKPDAKRLDLTQSSTGYICLVVFALCYGCVVFEECAPPARGSRPATRRLACALPPPFPSRRVLSSPVPSCCPVFGHGFRKSIPMTVCSGFLWTLVAWTYKTQSPGQAENVAASLRHNLLEFGAPPSALRPKGFEPSFVFLLAAMMLANALRPEP